MKRILLDFTRVETRREAHNILAESLDFPEYYGHNLDALYDVLSGMRGEIVLVHACTMLNALQDYSLRLLEVLFDAARDNRYLTFTVGGGHRKCSEAEGK